MLKASKLSCGANNKVDKILSSLEEASGNAKGIIFIERKCLKGLFTNFFLSFKSHILDSNGVWYR